MRIRSARCLFHLGILSIVMGVPCMHAQVSYVRSGSFELGPFLGASYGIDQARVMGGGNVTYAINKYILPYAEFSYFPGIGRTESGTFPQTGNPFSIHYQIPLSDIHGGVHIRLPVFHESPVVPYLVIGVGTLYRSARTVTGTFTTFGQTNTQSVQVDSGNDLTVNFGGGIRYYISQRFGVRVEAKAYKPTGYFTQTFGKAEFGVFFQLR
jgi:hypothetical protein